MSDRYPNAPDLEGMTFRHPRVPDDFPGMNAVANAARRTGGIEWVTSDEDFRTYYEHLSNCDPKTDVVVVTRGDRVVGYGRAAWRQEPNGPRLYEPIAFALPGEPAALSDAITETMERRCREIAASHPAGENLFANFVADRDETMIGVLDARGYQPVRYVFRMVRSNLDDLPDSLLPAGLEIRPVTPDQLRTIFDAEMEAMSDGWGFVEPTKETYERFVTEPVGSDYSLWRIAWDGDQVAGMVRGFINELENEEYERKRGYVENISTRRPWRKRGLARALIAATITALRERGMTEGALGVDSENPSGALRLYESCGFVTVSRSADYRKPFDPSHPG